MEKKIDPGIREKIEASRRTVQDFLPDLGNASVDDCQNIIGRYVCAIQASFLSWVGAAAITTRTLEARYAAQENFRGESEERHQQLLTDFAVSAHSTPSRDNYDEMIQVVQPMRDFVSNAVGENNGLVPMTLVTHLENTSLAFIPWLENVALKAGGSDLRYTQVHGEADIHHSVQFLEALSYEIKHGNYCDPMKTVDRVVERTNEFLKEVFTL